MLDLLMCPLGDNWECDHGGQRLIPTNPALLTPCYSRSFHWVLL